MNLQETLVQIIREGEKAKLPCLLVGGHAIVLYGITRLTRDFDILIPETSVEFWTKFLAGNFGYQLLHSTRAFIQFENRLPDFPPIDIMVVGMETWEKLSEKARSMELVPGVNVHLPHPSHLVALKLAALSSPTRRWDNEDWSDIIKLIYKQKLSLEDPEFCGIVLKYGGEETLIKLRKALKA